MYFSKLVYINSRTTLPYIQGIYQCVVPSPQQTPKQYGFSSVHPSQPPSEAPMSTTTPETKQGSHTYSHENQIMLQRFLPSLFCSLKPITHIRAKNTHN